MHHSRTNACSSFLCSFECRPREDELRLHDPERRIRGSRVRHDDVSGMFQRILFHSSSTFGRVYVYRDTKFRDTFRSCHLLSTTGSFYLYMLPCKVDVIHQHIPQYNRRFRTFFDDANRVIRANILFQGPRNVQ